MEKKLEERLEQRREENRLNEPDPTVYIGPPPGILQEFATLAEHEKEAILAEARRAVIQ